MTRVRRNAALVPLLLATACLVDFQHPSGPADGTIRIACTGDSNTRYGLPLPPDPPGVPGWCEYAQQLFQTPPLPTTFPADTPVVTENYAVGGSTLCHIWENPDIWTYGLNGDLQVTQALTEGADMLVLAFGTNDVRNMYWTGQTIDDIVACYQDAHALAAANSTLVLVALAPPIFPPYAGDVAAANALIDQLNARLRETFQSFEILDFHDGFTAEHFFPNDGLHLNDLGQQLRAARAYAQARYPY